MALALMTYVPSACEPPPLFDNPIMVFCGMAWRHFPTRKGYHDMKKFTEILASAGLSLDDMANVQMDVTSLENFGTTHASVGKIMFRKRLHFGNVTWPRFLAMAGETARIKYQARQRGWSVDEFTADKTAKHDIDVASLFEKQARNVDTIVAARLDEARKRALNNLIAAGMTYDEAVAILDGNSDNE
jgi:hypothetical protein